VQIVASAVDVCQSEISVFTQECLINPGSARGCGLARGRSEKLFCSEVPRQVHSRSLCKMPPPARVCAGCKGSKTRCIGFDPDHQQVCRRCARLNMRCIPAPQHSTNATRKLMKASTRALLAEEGVGTSMSAGTTTALEPFGPHNMPGESAIVDAIMCPSSDDTGLTPKERLDSLSMLLRSWVAISRRRNGYRLMAYVVYLCHKFGIALDDIMASTTAPEAGVPVQAPDMRQLLHDASAGSSSGSPSTDQAVHGSAPGSPVVLSGPSTEACHLVRLQVDGHVSFLANEAFERRFATNAEMRACWESNARPVMSLFMHPSDFKYMARGLAQVWRHATGPTDPGAGVTGVRIDGTPRLFDRIHSQYVRCSAEVSLSIRHQGRVEIVTSSWTPEEAAATLGAPPYGADAPAGAILNATPPPFARTFSEFSTMAGTDSSDFIGLPIDVLMAELSGSAQFEEAVPLSEAAIDSLFPHLDAGPNRS
jgi:hypothetical protein